uniref:Uncharacterized protein n=1 Tax=Sphaerodactylus townsendi TaxID=933632 RepID=A0ACB8E537_9SAUR
MNDGILPFADILEQSQLQLVRVAVQNGAAKRISAVAFGLQRHTGRASSAAGRGSARDSSWPAEAPAGSRAP